MNNIPDRYVGSIVALMVVLYVSYQGAIVIALTATISYLLIPYFIKWCYRHSIYAEIIERSNHTSPIPACGGIAMLVSMLPMLLYLIIAEYNFVLLFTVCIVFLAIVGMIDDRLDLSAGIKLFLQLAVAFVIIHFGDVSITSAHSIIAIEDLTLLQQYMLTLFIIVGVTNAMNLLDGLDGLAGSVGFITSMVLGLMLYISGCAYSTVCFALCGALLGFLNFNLSPAKVFMGDAGSLIIGFITIVCGIRLLQFESMANTLFNIVSVVPIVIGLFLLPVFDTIRLFGLRLMKKRSPFSADRNHLHHYIMDCGYNVNQSNRLIIAWHLVILLVSLSLSFTSLNLNIIIFIQFLTAAFPYLIITLKNHSNRDVSDATLSSKFKGQ